MIVYTIAYICVLTYAFNYLATNGFKTNAISQIAAKLLFLPAIAIVMFKANVGTDTANYTNYAETILLDPLISAQDLNIEYGFYWLLKVIVNITDSPHFTINFISATIAVYGIYLFSNNRNSIIIFSLLIFPVFFYDMTMNGLRYGLAFLLAKQAVDYYESKHKFQSVALLALCASMQVTGVIVFLLLMMKRLSFKVIVNLMLISVIVGYAYWDRLAEKIIGYLEFQSPNLYSGVMPLGIFIACYIVLLRYRERVGFNIHLMFLLEILSFILAKYSYAGLRFQLLILFSLFCAISTYKIDSYKNKKIVLTLFLIIGLIGFLAKLKNFADDFGNPPSPFMPYTFLWEASE